MRSEREKGGPTCISLTRFKTNNSFLGVNGVFSKALRLITHNQYFIAEIRRHDLLGKCTDLENCYGDINGNDQ